MDDIPWEPMMTLKKTVVVAAALLSVAIPMRAQNTRKLDISFSAGRVTIVAENVTLPEIFREWARKGGSRIVNAERLPGTPVMLTEFKDQPEADVLRTLLREAPGYGAAMRTAPDGASTVQTVFILAVRSTVASTSGSAAPIASQVQSPSPVAPPRMIQGSPDDEIPPVRPLSPEQNPSMPSTPAGKAGSQPLDPSLRIGPGGMVTSTKPGTVIPAPAAPAGPVGTPATPPGRGRGGGGGSR
ncbi:MAG: hypothetical protein ABIP90_07525 [Vicinamibacterales bacterium]